MMTGTKTDASVHNMMGGIWEDNRTDAEIAASIAATDRAYGEVDGASAVVMVAWDAALDALATIEGITDPSAAYWRDRVAEACVALMQAYAALRDVVNLLEPPHGRGDND